ncbi:MAG TPA: hemerythrin domain-containing protein [Casimicrobiaceae bacterium]|nr:hemerythrin domain-containing protein [Casimicrobiaceae bacterium]
MKAIRIIRDEHRTLAAVLHGMLYLVREVAERGTEPDFRVLDAMIYYIDTFPERFHHPKEDRYLFRILRQRCKEAAPLLDRLETEHRAGNEKIRALEQALARYHAGGRTELSNFRAAVESYASFHWDHMNAEERELLPLAEKHFTAADWQEVDAAFEGHADPLFNAEAGDRYAALFSRIVALAPPPLGVGPERAGSGR